MSDNTRYRSGDQEAQMPHRGVEGTNTLELHTMTSAAQIIESQLVALEKMQHDTSQNLRIPRLTKQTCGVQEQPRAEERDMCNRVEVDSELVIHNNCEITPQVVLVRRVPRYEVDGGVTLAGGRPGLGEDFDAEGLESSRSSSTLPPPYFSIPYP